MIDFFQAGFIFDKYDVNEFTFGQKWGKMAT